MKKFILFLLSVTFLAGFQFPTSSIPTKIEKINLKLLDDEIAFTFLHLSDGEATLIQNNRGEAVLINTGNESSKKELQDYLNLYGITSIQSIIITKVDSDYIGNIDWIETNYNVQQLILPNAINRKEFKTFSHTVFWNEGKQKELIDGLSVNVLQVVGNHNAMNLSFQYGKHRLLFMGIANRELEQELVNRHQLMDVNILKVAEFGTREGTSQALLESIDPQVAILFQKKDFYPSEDVLERLQATWIDIYYTKQFGNITIKANERHYEVITIAVESIQKLED